jgi:excisionase family DNA binding protein
VRLRSRTREISVTADSDQEPLWGVEEVAAYLQLPVKTLYEWRAKGYGPAAKRVGRHLRYKATEVVAWYDRLNDVAG